MMPLPIANCLRMLLCNPEYAKQADCSQLKPPNLVFPFKKHRLSKIIDTFVSNNTIDPFIKIDFLIRERVFSLTDEDNLQENDNLYVPYVLLDYIKSIIK